ncbi:MAG: hypothetical protein EXS35_16375 [Pedosphaera sp.]|nr:hypothetical protein [Pedosphaera sp.]
MHGPRTSPRSEYLLKEKQRVLESPSLAEKFHKLKSLTVDLVHFDPEGVTKNSQIKYTVNLEHAKSVFRFGCHNHECVRGDFDLSDVLTQAVTAKRKSVSGEARCQGWRSRSTIDTVPCRNILRYKFTLGY